MKCVSCSLGVALGAWLAGAAALSVGCGGDDDSDGDPDAGPDAGGSPDAGADAGVVEPGREQSGGAPSAIELVGDLAYVGIGPRLAIWRLPATAGEDPILVGETAPFAGLVTGVTVAGDRAFVSESVYTDGRIHVLDVSDPASPVETASVVLGDKGATVPTGMVAVGDRLFAADREQGIAELDISDPDAPVLIRFAGGPGGTAVEVVDTRLYYVWRSFIGGSGVTALDLDNDLTELGTLSFFGGAGVAISDQHLVVAAGTAGIQVFDMTDPALPAERFVYVDPLEGPFSRAVAVSGTTAWIPGINGLGDDGMHVLDLTDPAAIVRSGPFALGTQGAAAAAVADDTLAVVTDRGRLLVLDAGGAAEPTARAAAEVSLCSDCLGVTVVGDRLFAADTVGGLSIGDLGDLGPSGRSSEPTGFVDFEDVAVAGDYAYVADWAFGLRVYDVSDPTAPELVGNLDTPGYPSSVLVSGSRVYLGESTDGGALRVIDVGTPTEPVELGAVATSKVRDLELRGDLVFVADESVGEIGGLRIYDVSDPSAIALVGQYTDECEYPVDVALTGELAVVACAEAAGDPPRTRFHILDVSDPAAPTRLSLVLAPEVSSPWSVTAWEGGAALGHDYGVTIVDLSDPAAPTTTEDYLTSYTVRALARTDDGQLFASSGLGGMYRWQLSPP